MRIAKGAVLGLGLTAALGAAVPGFAGGNKYDSVSESQTCTNGSDVDYVNWVGPQKLWPPNHKMIAEAITALGDQTDSVSLDVMPTATDAVGGDGGPQHDPDWTPEDPPVATGTGSATVNFSLRAERSGRGDGRTYLVDWTANFGDHSCTSSDGKEGHHAFQVVVPHDMRPSNR